MYGTEQVITQRECRVIEIPDGTPMELPAGTSVRIAQALGDTYTLVTPRGQMVRLDARDADVIGKEPPAAPAEGDGSPLEEQVWGQLRTCFDPEIPVNIVDLGLIYDLAWDDENDALIISMTLTSAGCPLTDVIEEQTGQSLDGIVERFRINWVWMPPWGPERITDDGRDMMRAIGFSI